MSASVVVALETEMRIRRWSCQVVAPSQHVPSRWTSATISSVRLGPVVVASVAEADQHLVEHHVVGDRGAALGEPLGHPAGEQAAPLDEVGDAGAAELAQRRPDGEAASAPRGVGDEVAEGVVVAAGAGEVRRGVGHRAAVHRGVRDDRQPAVVGDVEPLVRVGRPRVGASTPATRCARPGAAAAHSPKAPSTCTQAPASLPAGWRGRSRRWRRCSRCRPGDRRSSAGRAPGRAPSPGRRRRWRPGRR